MQPINVPNNKPSAHIIIHRLPPNAKQDSIDQKIKQAVENYKGPEKGKWASIAQTVGEKGWKANNCRFRFTKINIEEKKLIKLHSPEVLEAVNELITQNLPNINNNHINAFNISLMLNDKFGLKLNAHDCERYIEVSSNWSKDEEDKFNGLLEKYGEANLNKITDEMETKNYNQCKAQLTSLQKAKWSHEEKKKLQSLVEKYGVNNWKILATEMGTKNEFQCRNHFSLKLDTKNLQNKWSKEEDDQLITLVQKYGLEQWSLIAKEMKKNDYECYSHWMKKLNPNFTKRVWSEEETNQLMSLVEKYGRGHWNLIAKKIGSRTHRQCYEHWRYISNPNFLKVKWSENEDKQLISLVQEHGIHNWTLIAKKIGTRNDKQCRLRWSYTLDPKFKKGEWNEDEDKQLVTLVEKYGAQNWTLIAKEMETRNEQQCRSHWVYVLDPQLKVEWSENEDKQLVSLVEERGTLSWGLISTLMGNRSKYQCRSRWLLLDSKFKKNLWSKEEEATLERLVEKYGNDNWNLISKEIESRNDDQCRLRWLNLSKGNPKKRKNNSDNQNPLKKQKR